MPGADLPLALECDDVDILKGVALDSDSVLAAPHAAVVREVAAGELHQLNVKGAAGLSSDAGIVTLRGRTPSPMASLIISRLPCGLAAAT